MQGFSVFTHEGDDDPVVYFCNEKPKYVSMPVEGGDEGDRVVMLEFVPKNGNVLRVGKTNYIPAHLILAIVDDKVRTR